MHEIRGLCLHCHSKTQFKFTSGIIPPPDHTNLLSNFVLLLLFENEDFLISPLC